MVAVDMMVNLLFKNALRLSLLRLLRFVEPEQVVAC